MLHRLTLDEKVSGLNGQFDQQSAGEILRHTLLSGEFGKVAVVSSFGAESVVLLDLVAAINPATPILFLDTEMLFTETLAYQKTVATHLGLTDVRVITPAREETFEQDNEGLLHLYFPDQCCALRKSIPLQQALKGFDAWITGRKRYQSGSRATSCAASSAERGSTAGRAAPRPGQGRGTSAQSSGASGRRATTSA